jgi:hypothetical protein
MSMVPARHVCPPTSPARCQASASSAKDTAPGVWMVMWMLVIVVRRCVLSIGIILCADDVLVIVLIVSAAPETTITAYAGCRCLHVPRAGPQVRVGGVG